MDIKFLVPTILSIISICFTIIGIKRLSLFQNWQVYFEENKEKIMNVFLRFKIQYYDLIGNRYEQEFRFAFYDDFNGKNKTYYSLNNISDLPKIVEENKYE
ncbi:hypothetical protein [Fusobacterium nucleatum]|uniref:hypothetical protein n=1 Tax=Fusobacterium nucleatum TaxID=851 RepID=UPI0030D087FB